MREKHAAIFACASLPYSRDETARLTAVHAAIRAKSVSQPHQTSALERDHVEAARGRRAIMSRQKVLRGAQDTLLLLPDNACRRAAISSVRTRAHFDEHERVIPLAHHEIDLTAAAHDVTRDEPQSLPLQKRQRMRFEHITDGFGPRAIGKVVRAPRAITRALSCVRARVAQCRPCFVCLRLPCHDSSF